MMADGDRFQKKGWMRLPFQFDAVELQALSTLNPHIGRGQRLTNMSDMAAKLPSGFKVALSEFGFDPTPLRAVGFNKSIKSNWSLPWHQDRVIAIAEKTANPNFKNWSRKSGIWHCEPKPAILAQMAFAYIAFDDIDAGMGGLELAEGTHKFGTICSNNIDSYIEGTKTVCPNIQAGEVLIISAMTLHRSTPMKMSGTRRTLRIDFAGCALNLFN